METYTAQTESGLISEELINMSDALEVAQWMRTEYQTSTVVLNDDGTVIERFQYQ